VEFGDNDIAIWERNDHCNLGKKILEYIGRKQMLYGLWDW
jgi:hypothetical protein